MSNGFLGYNASFMLDAVVCALGLVVPVLAVSIGAAANQRYRLHRFLQWTLAVLLTLAVTAFEVDMRMHGGWRNIVNKDAAHPRLGPAEMDAAWNLLRIHLVFAVTTPLLWLTTLILATRKFPSPPQPGPHSVWHRRLGKLAALDLVGTSVTGLWFYYRAFMGG